MVVVRRFFAVFFLLCAGIVFPSAPVYGHAVGQSRLGVAARPNGVDLVLLISVREVVQHFGPDSDADVLSRLKEYIQPRVSIEIDSRPVSLEWAVSDGTPDQFSAAFQEERLAEIDLAQQENGKKLYVHLTSRVPLKRPPRRIAVSADFSDRLGEFHSVLVKLDSAGQVEATVLGRDHPRQEFSLQEEIPFWEQNVQFVKLGIEHIFLGYDHLLFLLALLIVGGRWFSLVKIVTSFTVAHSITLIAATLGWAHLSSQWVEPAIALTIVYVGVENFFPIGANHRWILTFFFGLIHGFGFAGVLRELGLPDRGLFSALLSFNVGVEIGQLTVVVCLLPAIWKISRSRFRSVIVRMVSGLVVLLGLIWFLERAAPLIGSGR